MYYLCLDVGNTNICGGIYQNNVFKEGFRATTKKGWTSDEFGTFICSFCNERSINARDIKKVLISSVVPTLNAAIREASEKYFQIKPFEITSSIKTGLILDNAKEEKGVDLISMAIAAVNNFENKNIIIVSFGTATVILAISSNKKFHGGAILPGIGSQVSILKDSAEKLFSVEIKKPETAAGLSSAHAMQSGIYFGTLGAISLISEKISSELFNEKPVTIATGGYSYLFKKENFFNTISPNLVLEGLLIAEKINNVS